MNDNSPIQDENEDTNSDIQVISVEVGCIRGYDRNPRHARNPEYDRIKASIRTDGMEQPLVITQRPGEVDYVVRSGGNTRLQIVKELLQETEEQRFRTVQCVFRAWTRETDVLLAHLKENDLRGNLSFLDKARAIDETKQLMEQEGGNADISQRQLVEALKARGYNLSQGLLSHMQYTVHTLLPILPKALQDAMSRSDVERVRQLDSTVSALWLEREIDTQEEYTESFRVLCQRYDGPDWDCDNLRHALEAEMAIRSDLSIHEVRMELDRRLARRGAVLPGQQANPGLSHEKSTITDDREPTNPVGPSSAAEHAKAPSRQEQDRDSSEHPSPGVEEKTGTEQVTPGIGNDLDTTMKSPTSPSTPNPEPEDTESMTIIGTRGPTDLKSLRARCWTLAARLAQRNGLEGIVQPLPNSGIGFILVDVPDPDLADQLDDDKLAMVSTLWWQLAACCEITAGPLDKVLPSFREGSVLSRAMEHHDSALLFDNVWTLDPGNTGYRLWCRLDDLGWKDLLSLMDTYRSLHQQARQNNISLWG